MNNFTIEVTLKNGITDITISSFEYKDPEEVYKKIQDMREVEKYLKLTIDGSVIEYRFDDISMIKIRLSRKNKN